MRLLAHGSMVATIYHSQERVKVMWGGITTDSNPGWSRILSLIFCAAMGLTLLVGIGISVAMTTIWATQNPVPAIATVAIVALAGSWWLIWRDVRQKYS